jgi:hypothetical protein
MSDGDAATLLPNAGQATVKSADTPAGKVTYNVPRLRNTKVTSHDGATVAKRLCDVRRPPAAIEFIRYEFQEGLVVFR